MATPLHFFTKATIETAIEGCVAWYQAKLNQVLVGLLTRQSKKLRESNMHLIVLRLHRTKFHIDPQVCS